MDFKQGPFSLYDFLGYFFPGAVAIYGFAYSLRYLGIDDGLLEFAHLAKASELLPFVMASYISGHFFSLLSSFTVERYFIWHFDYPSKSLLRYPSKNFFEDRFSFVNVLKIVVGVILLPVTIATSIICFFSAGRPGLVSQLDPLLSKIIRRKITALIVDVGEIQKPNHYGGPMTSDFFRLAYHYTLENAPSHYAKMQNYVVLFGFNRAMSLVFVGLFWIGIASLFLGSGFDGLRLTVVCGALACLFFFGFAKFYRRFNLESLMALAVCYKIPDRLIGITLPKPKKGEKISVGRDLRKTSPFMNVIANARRRIKLKSAMHSL